VSDLARAQFSKHRGERRAHNDRRTRTVHALIRGSLQPRRRGPRRAAELTLTATDWHQSRWLAVALLILLLCVGDALLTLALLNHGAFEANPFMDVFLKGDAHAFVAVKFGLTAVGVILLTVVARLRAFGRFPVGFVLYGLLLAYASLVGYEVWLLHNLAVHGFTGSAVEALGG
jgi:hypothetical protein